MKVAARDNTGQRALTSPIKWPGGKSNEYPYIQPLIPQFDRYIEPFFGGGAIYFILRPARAVVNDFSADLMDFYRFLKGDYSTDRFSVELYAYVYNWEKIPSYIDVFEGDLISLYDDVREGSLLAPELESQVRHIIQAKEHSFNGLFSLEFCVDRFNLERQIVKNIVSKLLRMAIIEKQRGLISREDIDKNIETAFKSGFYMHFRDLMNRTLGKSEVSAAKYTANYYFIREFCYGAMFRYNANGHFNIPYGGIAYNKKDFRKKVDYILSKEFRSVFNGTNMENGDFEDAMKKHEVGEGDFVFLDPPYDSDFSDYDNNDFGLADHQRLANFVRTTKAMCMVLIKETPFIRALYEEIPGIHIESFDKRYLYNVKGRNNQDTNHLIIYNYDT